ARPIAEVPLDGAVAMPTGMSELDRVLSGGLVPGSVTVMGGEPGVGKSTVLLQALAGLSEPGRRTLYVTAEESAHQVRRRAERLGALHPELYLATETALPNVLAHLDDVAPAVAVIDSIQSLHDPALSAAPGSVSQVRHCAHQLVTHAKQNDRAVVIVGHVTKDGALAGPRVLEHVVDTVLSFEGERDLALRTLRATKHRFGSTGEVGLLAMAEGGLVPVPDPSELFLADRRPGVAGSVVAAAIEGRRPMLVEIQALVASTRAPQARRSVHGLDSGRVAMVLAVLQQRVGISLAELDTYAMAVGGARVVEPAADLAVALAVASSTLELALPDELVACAEIGLGGELRHVAGVEARLAEAARLGFRRAVVAASCPEVEAPLRLARAGTVRQALASALESPEFGPSHG
ncbi:MAG TPA: DNA repair protein RadA, partial [Microthrixaceae bacterium]|nr:DNA repair protein RadA [Microthrixaceae bacterium]